MIALVVTLTTSNADVCANLRSQLRGSGGGGGGSEAAQLVRQIVAIRSVERQRQCSSNRSGGLFNACDELGKRRAEAQRQLDRAKLGKNGANIKARLASLGYEAGPLQQGQRQASRSEGRRSYSGVAMLFCVRLGDGYYFPAPNSQFVGDDAYENTLDRCRYICNDSAVDVYRLDDGGLETEEMVSVEGRRPYRELPAAFAYRQATAFKSCDVSRYSRRVEEARARSVKPSNMGDVVIPLPTPKPEVEDYSNISPSLDAPVSAYAGEASARRVRIVGPTFLPED